MKVAFTYYPAFVRYNHGAAILSQLCRNAGIETKIIPMGRAWKETLEEFCPDYVCFSFVTVHDYQMAKPFIDQCSFPKLAGGVYLRKGGKVTEDFDHVCRGEAETLPNFFLHGKKELFEKPLLSRDISTLPDYSDVKGNEFDRGYAFLKGKKIIPYSHSRGCPCRCSFCEVQNLPKVIRIKNTIKRDLEKLKNEHTPDMFYFLDELLPYYNQGWREQFDGNTVPFIAYIRADISPDDLQFLIKNGMVTCAMGIESGNERYRNDVLKKDLTDQEIFRTIAILQHYKVNYINFFMVGTPGETKETRNHTYGMLQALGGNSTVWQYEELRG